MDILTAGEILVGPLDNNIYNCLETCFSFLLIPIADCKQSQQILYYKFWKTFSGWIMIQGRGDYVGKYQIANGVLN